MIKVLLADDHKVLREGLKVLLKSSPEITVVGEANNGVEVLELLNDNKADVILLDLEMPIMDGIDTLKKVKAEYNEINVLMLTNYNRRELTLEIMENGASGYILKTNTFNVVLDAIKKVFNGEPYFDSEVLKEMISNNGKQGTTKPVGISNTTIDILTSREKSLIPLIAQGLTSKQIAEQLNIAKTTVDKHRGNILRKLKLENQKQLVSWAIKNGLA